MVASASRAAMVLLPAAARAGRAPGLGAGARRLQARVATATCFACLRGDDKLAKQPKWPAMGRNVARRRKEPCPGQGNLSEVSQDKCDVKLPRLAYT